MAGNTNIALVGFMGTGKSSAGRFVAARLSMNFIDIDEEIEKVAGMPIKVIFEKFGEQHFRDIERKQISRVSQLENVVIATGGGAVTDPANMNELKKSCLVVCLSASINEIVKRIGETEEGRLRPLFAGKSVVELDTLFEKRRPFYEKADIIIDTDGKTIEKIAELIVRFCLTRNILRQAQDDNLNLSS